jgi:predicted Fe-Mo cluster-binding NifX family protein
MHTNPTENTTTLVAVPSANPGGLDAEVSAHFGHCDVFTLVETDGVHIRSVVTVPNVAHEQGGCMAPVALLASSGVEVLIAGGMGMRPLMGLQQAGVRVVHWAEAPSVGHAVRAFLANELPEFALQSTCGGHH